jgi:hypothetical protein
MIKTKKIVTLLSRKAAAKCCAPSSLIWFPSTLSVLSVYMRKVDMWTRKIRRDDIHQATSESSSEIFHPFVGDFIRFERECRECLWKKSGYLKENYKTENNNHRIISESICQILHPCISNSIISEIKYGECLFDKLDMWMRKIKRKSLPCYFGKH